MQQAELNQKTRVAAERAAINEAKQQILFKWHRNQRPTQHNIFCSAVQYPIYRKAVQELNEQYNSCVFSLHWHN